MRAATKTPIWRRQTWWWNKSADIHRWLWSICTSQRRPFFLWEFGKLDATCGYHLNRKNTRIMTSTLSTSSLPDIEHTYGKKFTDELQLAIVTHSVKETLPLTPPSYQSYYQQTWHHHKSSRRSQRSCSPRPINWIPLLATQFFTEKIHNNNVDVTKLLATVGNHQTALRLFAQCTLHKLHHLLGSEVMYRFT